MNNDEGKKTRNRYDRIIERVFTRHSAEGTEGFEFSREEIADIAAELDIKLPKNLGDVIYTYRYRRELPRAIVEAAPPGKTWSILPAGVGRYRFVAEVPLLLQPTRDLAETKVPDATPGLIALYALSDEQALLAKLRYNRLIDIFTGVTCCSLQNHLRTTVPDFGQIETDEIYVGVDRRGAHYVFPVEAKAAREKLGSIQIRQDLWLCKSRFPNLICRPIGAQLMKNDVIALFEFVEEANGIKIASEKHYRLVPPRDMSPEDLEAYRHRLD